MSLVALLCSYSNRRTAELKMAVDEGQVVGWISMPWFNLGQGQ